MPRGILLSIDSILTFARIIHYSQIKLPASCLLNPSQGAAVVGGNVLTSQRVTDVILK